MADYLQRLTSGPKQRVINRCPQNGVLLMKISKNNPDPHPAHSENPQPKRKIIEEQLRFQTAILKAQSEASPDGILVVSGTREWLMVNQRFIKMWRIPETVAQPRPNKLALQMVMDQLIDPDQFVAQIDYLYEHPAEESHDEIALKDGRIFDRYSTPIYGVEGELYGRVWYYRDVTEHKQVESALRESEKRYRLLIEQSPLSIQVFDANGVLIDANKAWEELWGAKADQVVGKHNPLTDPQIKNAGLLPLIERAFSGEPVELGDVLFDPGVSGLPGHKRWIRTHAYPIKDETGAVQNVVVFNQDITDQVQATKALQEQNSFRSAIIQRATEGLCVCHAIEDFPYVQFTEWNDKMEAITGYTLPEINEKGWYQSLYPDPDVQARAIERMDRMRYGDDLKAEEWIITRADGQKRTVVISTRLLETGDGTAHVLALMEDVTERHQAEEALRKSEAYFRSLIENISDIITVLDIDGTIRFESPSIERVMGYTPDELIGKNAFSLVYPFDLATVQNALAERVSIPGPAPSMELRIKHKDGSWRNLEIIGNNLLDDPAVNSIVVTSRDITERKQLEEQLRQAQRMEAVGQLTAGIAHDFNNLLTTINGFAELIRQELAPDDPSSEMIGKVLHAGQRAADLVSQLLAFSRKQIIQPQVLNLNSVVVEMDKMLQRTIGEHIELKTMLSPDLHPIKMDPVQIEQVILNLSLNARDAMPNGGRLTIETANVWLNEDYVASHFETEPGAYVRLAVSDTGTGISREIQAHIFEPFFTTKEVGQGTGLGLATVYGIIKQSSGSIQVYSEPGQGTVFKLYLPQAEAAPRKLIHTQIPAEMPTGTETILLVEDAAGVREFTLNTLQAQGYTVIEAQDGQEALQLAAEQTNHIHLLLTDVVMPGISGQVLAQQLIQSRPDLKILYMSGYTDNAIAHHGVLEPGIAFLQKPFSPVTLAQKVRDVLDSS